jgi:hypothetical protein
LLLAAVNIGEDEIGDRLENVHMCSCATDNRKVSTLSTGKKRPVLTKEILARRWGIGLDTAHRTLTATTQHGVRRVLHPVERRYRTTVPSTFPIAQYKA